MLLLPENEHCLLLRFSGTTAHPKGVPLAQGTLVNSGVIIAASMQLMEEETLLFHIDGLSASIL